MEAIAESNELFDRRFVVAACIIGIAYSAIAVLVGEIAGKEVAGVAGVALTALATGIFKQFETLRFRAIAVSQARELHLPKLSLSRILLISFSFLGLQMILGVVLGGMFALFGTPESVNAFGGIFDILSNWKFLFSVIGLVAISYLIIGYISSKAFGSIPDSDIVIAAFVALLFSTILPMVTILIANFNLFKSMFLGQLWMSIFWVIYLLCAFLGARVSAKSISLSGSK